jgi:glycyl-tRNA synthetase
MVFIVKKKIGKNEYYYLNETRREGEKVVSKCLGYLGKTKKEAEIKKREILKTIEQEKKNMEKKTDEKVKEVSMEENETDEAEKKKVSMEEIAMFCKRKGFVYPSGELYGSLAGFWDYGPFGCEFKNNIKNEWWNFHVQQREDIVGIDGSIITNSKIWEASGHVESFVDIAVVCKKCKNKSKVDKHELEITKCEKCGGDWESKGQFNPMFTTYVGPIKEDSVKAYLRPETAQLIFADFKQVAMNSRLKLPFGIAQVGRSFRNEIAPRNFIFRNREFEQMEIEYFIDPDKKEESFFEIPDVEILVYSSEMQEKNKEPEMMKIKDALSKGIISLSWHAYWLSSELKWFFDFGANPKNFRIRQHVSEERSHYSTDTWDIEYNFPFGWKELQGIADRGNYDLEQHEKYSKKDLKIMDDSCGKKILPMVVAEPSLGVERAFLVFLLDAYKEDKKRNNIVLKLNPKLSPVKAAIFPIVKGEEFEKISRDVYDDLKKEFNVFYDLSGSVGRRYARQDEIGTPYCITIDGDSLKNKDVTVRDRDTAKQIRVKISELKDILRKLIFQEIFFENAGKSFK